MSDLPHPEDLIFQNQDHHAIDVFDNLINHSDRCSISHKWDGRPAVLYGFSPNGERIIATKAIFNKVPVYYRCKDEIDRDPKLSSELKTILWNCLRHLPRLWHNIPGRLVQGDILFSGKLTESNGYTTPNTITYYFPGLHDRFSLGIAFHSTRYLATPNLLNANDDIFIPGSSGSFYSVKSYIGKMPSLRHKELILPYMDTIKACHDRLPPEFMMTIATLWPAISKYLNMTLTKNRSPDEFIANLFTHSAPSEKTMNGVMHRADLVRWLEAEYVNLDRLFLMHNCMTLIKRGVMLDLYDQCPLPDRIQTSYNGQACNNEGFVFWIDSLSQKPVKLVERDLFTVHNQLKWAKVS